MQVHLNQVQHNEKFHLSIHSSFADSYFDWKITCLFYVAIHCLKALAAKQGVIIGNTHKEIEESISPLKPNPIFPISATAWNNYKNLYRYSRSCRYNGFTNEQSFEATKRIDHNYSIQSLNKLKGYIKGQGVPI